MVLFSFGLVLFLRCCLFGVFCFYVCAVLLDVFCLISFDLVWFVLVWLGCFDFYFIFLV